MSVSENLPENVTASDALNLQTAQIPWLELQRSYAQGRVIAVRSDLDLVQIAAQLVENDTDSVESLIRQNAIMFASDEQALKWFEKDAQLWAVVVTPWVLVQDKN